jgi:hypothetical protein
MPFPVMVLVPSNTEDMVAAVTRLMSPFDAGLTISPHKEYVAQDEIIYVVDVFRHEGLKAEDVEAVLRALEEDSGCPGGIDERGIYLMTTDNPQAHWDSWRIQSLHNDVRPVPRTGRDRAPAEMITPDGVWHDLNAGLSEAGDLQVSRWNRAELLLAQYPDHVAVTVHCHM